MGTMSLLLSLQQAFSGKAREESIVLNTQKIYTFEYIHYLSLSPWGTHKVTYCKSVCWKTLLVENQLVVGCQKWA